MNPEIDHLVQMERRKDEIRAAAHHRLVKQAMIEVKPRVTIRPAVYYLTLALAYLGEHMLDWSARLQCRYHVLVVNSKNQPEPCL
jgi:hypothetical protein